MAAVLKERRSDIDAFVEHRGKLWRHLKKKLSSRNMEDIEDLLQEVAIRYWRRVVEPTIPLAYLYQISNHVLADYLENRTYRLGFEVEDMGDAIEETAGASMQEVADGIDTERRVSRMLAPLPCMHRAVIILHKMHGYSYEEVATKLNISVFTVEKYLTQGKFAMRNKK